jgi:acetolactate synthase I/II/III large subunit
MEAGAALVNTIINAGIDTAFTVPGESFLAVLEALRLNQNRIRLVSVRQEGGGSFAAHGYAQVKRKPAAVFVSRGPGAANASIGLHAAHQDSIPMVMFLGQVRSHMKGRESFQEIDPTTSFGSMSKAVLEPNSPQEMVKMARQAVEISQSGRPGPVVVVMPRDFGEVTVDENIETKPYERKQVLSNQNSLNKLINGLNKSEKPILLAGELARGSNIRDLLVKLSDKLGAPIISAYRCQDVVENQHPSYAGHLEINPVNYQDNLFRDSDFIVVLGSRLDGITSREETLIKNDDKWAHIHPDSIVLQRFNSDISIQSDVAPLLTEILGRIEQKDNERGIWRSTAHDNYLKFSTAGTYPVNGSVDLSYVAQTTRELLSPNSIVLTDGGSYARWIHRFFRFDAPLTQGGTASGAMGGGVPGAIGAYLAGNDDRMIVAFTGDGGFMMSGQELSTAVREQIPIKIIVCDNNVHGSILKGQADKYGLENAFGTIMGSPDFAQIARAYGAKAWTVKTTEDWRPSFKEALSHDGPALIHLIFNARDIAPYGNEKDAV